MTEARWRALIEVADSGSIRSAAGRLVVTESAVSAAVSSLAREVGVPLLERVGRGIQLTPAGARYADYLRQVLGLLDEAAVAARGELEPYRGRLRLGCVTTVGDRIVPQLLGRFRTAYPEVELRLEVGPSARVWSLFADHHLDIVVAGRPVGVTGSVRRAQCANELLVVGAPHVVAGFDLATTTWLLREPDSGTRATTIALLADMGANPPTMTLGSIGAVTAGALAGLGVTLIAREAVEDQLGEGLLALGLPGLPLVRPWYVTTRRAPSATAELMVQFLLDDPVAAQRWRPMTLPRRAPSIRRAPATPATTQRTPTGTEPIGFDAAPS